MAIRCKQLPLLRGRGLAPIHLANDADGLEMRSDNAASQLVLRTQSERNEASTAAQSSEMQGEAPPLLYPGGGKNYASW
jgi:hypothetical protein